MAGEMNALLSEWRSMRNPNLFLTACEAKLDFALQPITDIRNGNIYGYEALLRNFEALDFSAPKDVLDFGASIGVLPRLEMLLRLKAVTKYAKLPNAFDIKLFFNMDGRILEHDGFLFDETVSLLKSVGLAPANICLEIPETCENESLFGMDAFVRAARERGFAFAVDDFGRGQSQLKLLYDCEPHLLKIDRFFITSIQKDSRKRLFVSSVVDLAHVLGIRVVAEGVETADELNSCREVGCDLVQGYFVSRPFLDLSEARDCYDVVGKVQSRSTAGDGTDVRLLENEVQQFEPVPECGKVPQLLDIFQRSNQPLVPVINTSGEPVGIVREADLKTFIYRPFGKDLLQNPATDTSVRKYMKWCPSAEIDSRLDRLVDSKTDRLEEGVLITRNGRYCGFLSTAALLRIANGVRLHVAEGMNPLTLLPGYNAVAEHAQKLASGSGEQRALCYVNFDNFKPFNDTYGFQAGDRAIRLFADMLRRKLPPDHFYLGHSGADDFFIAMNGYDINEVAGMAERLRARFMREAESLYEPHHREQGYVLGQDRNGKSRKFPLLSCSAGVLFVDHDVEVRDSDLLCRTISAIKRKAKGSPNGVVVERLESCAGEVPVKCAHPEEAASPAHR